MTFSEKTLAAVEKIAWLLAILGFAAKWNLLAAGNIMLILGLGALSSVYLLRAYQPAAPVENPSFLLDNLLPKYLGIGGAVVFMGVLFKLMTWNNGTALLLVGTITTTAVVLLTVFNQLFASRALAAAALGGLLLYVPAETLVRQFHHDDPVLVTKMIYQLNHPLDRAAAADVHQYLQQKRATR